MKAARSPSMEAFFFRGARHTLRQLSLSTTLSTKSCRSPQKSLSRDSFHDAQVFRSASRRRSRFAIQVQAKDEGETYEE